MKPCADCGARFSGPPEIELCKECAAEHEQDNADQIEMMKNLSSTLDQIRGLASKAEQTQRPDIWIQTLGFIVNVIDEAKGKG